GGFLVLRVFRGGLGARGVAGGGRIVGRGPAGAALQAQWTEEGVQWIEGATPADVRERYGAHDVLVLPSRAEGLSVATVEAMIAGVVPVVSDLAGMREIVDGTGTGIRLPVGDIGGFVDAIASLARDRARLDAMSAAAPAFVQARFGPPAGAAADPDLF